MFPNHFWRFGRCVQNRFCTCQFFFRVGLTHTEEEQFTLSNGWIESQNQMENTFSRLLAENSTKKASD